MARPHLILLEGGTDRVFARRCTECGCTDDRACITDEGPCWWAAYDLCSACAGRDAEDELGTGGDYFEGELEQ